MTHDEEVKQYASWVHCQRGLRVWIGSCAYWSWIGATDIELHTLACILLYLLH